MKKRTILLMVVMGLMGATLVSFVRPAQASAVGGGCWFNSTAGPVTGTSGCAVPGSGAYLYNDVLTGRTPGGAGDALGGIGSKGAFIDRILSRFNNGNTQDRVGAAFIMQVMRGDHGWPSSADRDDWEARMRDGSVDFNIDYNVPVYVTSWYDPGPHNTFFDNYPDGGRTRNVIFIRQHGQVRAEIEISCGNMTGQNSPLDKIVPPFFNNSGDSSVNKSTAKPGDTVTFTHTITNIGRSDMNKKLNAHVGLSGSASDGDYKDCDVANGLNSGQKTTGCSNNYKIPASAKNGAQYCQEVYFYPNTTDDPSQSHGNKVCVTVSSTPPKDVCPNIAGNQASVPAGMVIIGGKCVTPPPNANNGSCSIGVSPYLNEVSSSSFNASYYGSVQTANPTDTGTRYGSWGAADKKTGVSSRIDTRTTVTYMLNSSFSSYYSGDGSYHTQGGGSSGSGPSLSAYTSFGYAPSNYPTSYNVSGSFSYSVVKVTTSYYQEDTRNKAGTISYGYSYGYPSYAPGPQQQVGCGSQNVLFYARPYVKVYGGDVEAGFGPSAAPTGCSDTSARIESWNLGAGSYAGAGSQFGAQALSVIRGFASAQNAGGFKAPRAGTGLSFANTSTGGDQYGGYFNNSDACINYAANLGATTTSIPYSVPNGVHTTVHITGDVYIDHNITFSGNYGALNQIPSLKLIADGGNIFIAPGVTELDGLYVAQPNSSGRGGAIYTCASGINAPINGSNDSNYYNDCGTQLRVYGSFVASKINFLRTYGRVNSSSGDSVYGSNAGEMFLYGPEQWLGQAGNANVEPNSITSLPPTL